LVEDVLLTRKILAIGEGLALKMGDRWGDPRRKRSAWEIPEKVEEDNGRQVGIGLVNSTDTILSKRENGGNRFRGLRDVAGLPTERQTKSRRL
jgi:hypothetical protein